MPKGKSCPYTFLRNFDSIDELNAYLGDPEHPLTKRGSNEVDEGTNTFYHCTRRTYYGCKATAKAFFPSDSQEIHFSLGQPHVHNSSHKALRSPVKEVVKNGLKVDMKTFQIRRALNLNVAAGAAIPNKVQLANLMSREKKNLLKNTTTVRTDQDLLDYFASKTDVPDSIHQPFIPIHYVEGPEKIFALFTTSEMLNLVVKSDILVIDATYKLTWSGYPIVLIGTVAKDRSFHPFGLAIVSVEDTITYEIVLNGLKTVVKNVKDFDYIPAYIMADGAVSITAAAHTVFPTAKRLMCWAHVKRAVKRNRNDVKPDAFEAVLHQISILQLCPNPFLFNKGSKLLLDHWKFDLNAPNFARYFDSQWIDSALANWYEGAAILQPSTNNALEAVNKDIKDRNTFRERLQMQQFLTNMERMLTEWSEKQREFVKSPPSELQWDRQLWLDAQIWIKKPLDCHLIDPQNQFEYVVESSKNEGRFGPAEYLEYVRTEEAIDWEEFSMILGSWHIVNLRGVKIDDIYYPTCTCRVGVKQYVCKHIVGLQLRLKLVKSPPFTEAQKLSGRIGRGRPRKVASALNRD